MSAALLAPSRLRITPFELIRPRTLDEAIDAVAAGARPLAGGIDLIDAMKRGYQPAALVQLSTLPDLRSTRVDRQTLFLGAGLTHVALCADVLVRRHLPDLATAWSGIANLRIRARGTLGGNLMAGHPGYEALVMLGALDATAVFANPAGRVRVPVADAASQAGLLLGVELPCGARLRLERCLRPALSFAVAWLPGRPPRLAIGGPGTGLIVSRDAQALADLPWPAATPLRLRRSVYRLVQRMLDADLKL